MLEGLEEGLGPPPSPPHSYIDEEDVFKMKELIAEQPRDVLKYLEEEGVAKLGQFDAQVGRAAAGRLGAAFSAAQAKSHVLLKTMLSSRTPCRITHLPGYLTLWIVLCFQDSLVLKAFGKETMLTEGNEHVVRTCTAWMLLNVYFSL